MSVFVWRKLRESDLLKYEFITTVTHKFRTPLTHIKWASENLFTTHPTAEQDEQLQYIKTANTKLVELTNLLVGVSEAERSEFDYRMEKCDIAVAVEEVIVSIDEQIKSVQAKVEKDLEKGVYASCDVMRIKFIIQTFIENAIHYMPKGGNVHVSVKNENGTIVCRVKDEGIGIAKEEVPMLFTKFYRGDEARRVDTEGMGIGLFIAKQIINHHHGKIWVESEGLGRGSTFGFSLSAVK
jgi:two-component system phosphate regulon sensor histidine kinase PhoR